MTEVLFGDSEAASMKCAKGSRGILGPAAVLGDISHMPEMKKEWTGVPGSPDEVLCLGYMLDIGSIQEPADSQQRKHMLLRMQAGWTNEDLEKLRDQEKSDGWQEPEKLEELQRLRQYDKDYARLKQSAADKEAIRIWYSSKAPYSYCGLCWLCYELAKTKAEIYVIDLPEYEVREQCIVRNKSWGEMVCEQFSSYLDRQKKLTGPEQMMYAGEWMEAAEKNSMLRAVVNGKLLSVPEDFYDFLILDRLTGQPEKEGRIIGEILGKTQMAVGDWWYAYRIQKMTECGRIGIAKDSRREYEREIYKK